MEAKNQIIHDFNDSSDKKKEDHRDINRKMKATKIPIAMFIVLALLGLGTGYVLANMSGSSVVSVSGPGGKTTTTSVSKGQTFGSTDEKTFKDTAEGTLKTGGIDGEGAYHLERPGGVSQNVYVTSSFMDLAPFVGKKVKVWGQTNSAEKAGWLMDVGRLQVQ